MSWYLRSMADHDTHRGKLQDDGTVVAQCGIQFPPRPLPFNRISLPPAYPVDPDQVCPQCQPAKRTR